MRKLWIIGVMTGFIMTCMMMAYAPSWGQVGSSIVSIVAHGAKVTGTANQATGGTSTSLIAAVLTDRIYVEAFSCANTGSTASLISFQDGNGGSTLWTTIVPAGGGSNAGGAAPLFWTTIGNPLYFVPATSSATVYCSASGYAGP